MKMNFEKNKCDIITGFIGGLIFYALLIYYLI